MVIEKSNFLTIVKNPFTWIILIIIIAVIILIIQNKKQNKVQPAQSCNDNQILCAGQCYDKKLYDCVEKDTKPCLKTKHCSGTDLCCPEGDFCIDGQCQVCSDSEVCGKYCCTDPKQPCCGTDCCDPSLCGVDSVGNKLCCKQPLCGGVCCDVEAGEECFGGKCVVGCPSTNLNKDQIIKTYSCDLNYPKDFDTAKRQICETGFCVHDCKAGTYTCAENACKWSLPTFTNFSELLDSEGKQVLLKGKGVYYCQDKNNNSYIIDTPEVQHVQDTVTLTSNNPGPNCTVQKCIDAVSYNGTTVIDSDIDKTGAICKATIRSANILLDPKNSDGINEVCDILGSRCCKSINGNYTGQICQNGEICDTDGICYTGFKFNDATFRCEPTVDPLGYNHISDCYNKQPWCNGQNCSEAKWRDCICCPNYRKGTDCRLYYKMDCSHGDLANSFPFKPIGGGSWRDTDILIFVPKDLKLVLTNKYGTGTFNPSPNLTAGPRALIFNCYQGGDAVLLGNHVEFIFNLVDIVTGTVLQKNISTSFTSNINVTQVICRIIGDNDAIADTGNHAKRTFTNSKDYKKLNASVIIGDNDGAGTPNRVYISAIPPDGISYTEPPLPPYQESKSYLETP